MEFAFNEDQLELKKGARRFLESHADSAQIRRTVEDEDGVGYDEQLWDRISSELLWPGLAIPEEYGGYGFGFVELAAIFEETGRALLPSPLFSNIGLAAQVLLEAGSEAQKSRYLPQLAESSAIIGFAHLEQDSDWERPGTDTQLLEDGGTYTLNGQKSYVLWGHAAQLLIVTAYTPSGDLRLVVVPADASGVTVERLPVMDLTMPQAAITFEGTPVEPGDILDGSHDCQKALERALQRATVLLSCEQTGIAEACLDMSVDYAKTRKQFGKPIGAFQAIKHKCADMMMLVESIRSAAYYAAWAADHEPDALAEAISVAQSYASPATFTCASENIQIHGGIGITWEHDSQMYFKRAQVVNSLLGTAADHNRRLLDHLLS